MYGFETWSATLREENRTCVELRAEGGAWRWQEAGDRCIMEELHDLPPFSKTPNVITLIYLFTFRH